jgi:hypothetical protein
MINVEVRKTGIEIQVGRQCRDLLESDFLIFPEFPLPSLVETSVE